MKRLENEVVEYLYERMVKQMLPISQMPKTFPAFIGKFVGRTTSPPAEAVLAFNKPEFENLIRLLMNYEQYGKPNKDKSGWNGATPLSRRSYPNAVRKHNNEYKKLCKVHYRICEIFRLLELVPDDFIAYVKVSAALLGTEDDRLHRKIRVEFSIGLGGFDIMGADGKRLPHYKLQQVVNRWEQVCADEQFFSDFSILISKAGLNGIIFLMDYEFDTMHN
jgi:hypothetical protein